MVKNEADVIATSLRHQLAQGLDAVLVADNGSTDDTIEILRDLARSMPIHIAYDRLKAYHQSDKMTYLSRVAARSGADWILPFDADEYWFAVGTTVANYLRTGSFDVVRAEMHNMFLPTDATQVGDDMTFSLDLTRSKHSKVAFRGHPLAILSSGNHDVLRHGVVGSGLYVAHLPWRSFEQFQRKVAQGKAAAELTGMPTNVFRHWRVLGALDEAELRNEWARVLAGVSQHETSWSPIGPFVSAPVLTWPSWRIP